VNNVPELSKLIRALKDVIAPKYDEFINVQLFPKLKDKVQDILTKKYPEYLECKEYVDFVTCYAKRDPQPISKAKEIVDRLLKSNDKLPPFWKEFLLESCPNEFLTRVEAFRKDPALPEYLDKRKS